MLRQSERSTFRRCPQKWAWSYLEGLVPNTPDRGARWFGTGLHLCWAEWYIPGFKRGRDPHDTWDEFCEDSEETIRIIIADEGGKEYPSYADAKELGHDVITQYLYNYGEDPHWEVIAAEKRVSVLIPNYDWLLDKNAHQLKASARNVGTMDLVVRDHNDGFIKGVDHKHVAAISTLHLPIDDQPGSYIAFGTKSLRDEGVIGTKEFIRGMEFNFIRKQKIDHRPKNADGKYTNKPKKQHFIDSITVAAPGSLTGKETIKDLEALADKLGLTVLGDVSLNQGTPMFERVFTDRTTAERNAQVIRTSAEVKVMNAFREGTLPVYKNPTDSCPWSCDFFDLCVLHEGDPQGAEELKKLAFKQIDPYADHREGAENSKASVKADTRRKEDNHG